MATQTGHAPQKPECCVPERAGNGDVEKVALFPLVC